MMSTLRILVLFGFLMIIFMAMGAILAVYYGMSPMGTMIVFLIIAGIFNLISYFWSDKIVLRAYNARVIEPDELPFLHEMVIEVSDAAGIPTPRIAVVPSQNPNAFATGRNPEKAVVAVTQGILSILGHDELKGVIAHEIAHVKDRDMLVMSVAATIVGAITIMTRVLWYRMLFGGQRNMNPVLLIIAFIPAVIGAMMVKAAISRSREFKADKIGAGFTHDPDALARALEKLHFGNQRYPMKMGSPASSSLFIVNPFSGDFFSNIFSTHPPMEKRIAALRQM